MKKITGVVFSGKGTGAFFVGLAGYQRQFRERLRLNPFPGTLNVHVEPDDAARLLSELSPIKISGFTDSGKAYGELSAYRVAIAGEPGYVIIPEKTFYKEDVFEIISEVSLRKTLNLRDGETVEIGAENEE